MDEDRPYRAAAVETEIDKHRILARRSSGAAVTVKLSDSSQASTVVQEWGGRATPDPACLIQTDLETTRHPRSILLAQIRILCMHEYLERSLMVELVILVALL